MKIFSQNRGASWPLLFHHLGTESRMCHFPPYTPQICVQAQSPRILESYTIEYILRRGLRVRVPVFSHTETLCKPAPLCLSTTGEGTSRHQLITLLSSSLCEKKSPLPKHHIIHEDMDSLSCLPLCLQHCLVLP